MSVVDILIGLYILGFVGFMGYIIGSMRGYTKGANDVSKIYRSR